MTITAAQIKANAERLSALTARINETVKFRSRSPSDSAQWEAACAAFHEQFGELFFPGGEMGWSAFVANDSEGIEYALLFLEVDQYTFRSGYLKQTVWDRLKKLYLTPEEHRRLEEVALAYLRRRVQCEFWHMANFMRLRASSSFWRRVETLAADGEDPLARKARWLLLTRKNAPVRQWIRGEVLRFKYEPGYTPRLDFPMPPS